MGSWFSNLHVRKDDAVAEADVAEYIKKALSARNYLPTASAAAADAAFAIMTDERSQWYSVCSDMFSFDDPTQFADFSGPMSLELKTDILGIACLDSDYVYLNLINADCGTDAWVGVGFGDVYDIERENDLSAWEEKVDDFDRFKECAKRDHVFAEEFLVEIENCIRLSPEYSTTSYEYLEDTELAAEPVYLYFKLAEKEAPQNPPVLAQHCHSLMPCFLGQPSLVSVINQGGESKGLSLYFVGPYVKNEEITFTDVSLIKDEGERMARTPISLEKVQLTDGQWAYYYHDPDFKIPPKVDDGLSPMKKIKEELSRVVSVRFVPQGEPRKILDITAVFVPDENPQGQSLWNVWHEFGSKERFISYHNKSWSRTPKHENLMLRAEDFD